MHGACLVSVTPPWTPHASVSPHPTLFYIFYKCAKLCGFCQEWWWSSVAGTFRGQTGGAAALGVLCHLQHRAPGQLLPSYITQRAREKDYTILLSLNTSGSPAPPTPAQGMGTRLPSCPRAPAWPGSVLLATCRGMTRRGAGERVGTTVLSPGRAQEPT